MEQKTTTAFFCLLPMNIPYAAFYYFMPGFGENKEKCKKNTEDRIQ